MIESKPNPLLQESARRAKSTDSKTATWSQSALAGRFCELSACGSSACLTLASGLVLNAQRNGEPAAWITTHRSSFFPPDVAAGGIDLRALVVVRVSDSHAAARVAGHLTRSGAFGLLMLDLGADVTVPMPLQTRLLGLAQKHDTAIVCLTEKKKEAPSISSLISLRAEALRTKTADGQFTCKAEIIKDKRRGPGWSHIEVHRGPPGLR